MIVLFDDTRILATGISLNGKPLNNWVEVLASGKNFSFLQKSWNIRLNSLQIYYLFILNLLSKQGINVNGFLAGSTFIPARHWCKHLFSIFSFHQNSRTVQCLCPLLLHQRTAGGFENRRENSFQWHFHSGISQTGLAWTRPHNWQKFGVYTRKQMHEITSQNQLVKG